MDNLIIRFQETIKKQHLFSKGDRLLLAVSGGVDSVVLAECCSLSGYDFGIAHANFQMREQESERDEEFVKTLAAKYEKPFLVIKMDTIEYSRKHKVSVQVAARELRYQWFDELLEKDPGNYRFLLTAHHVDDNIETMLMHFFRGTGISGIAGHVANTGETHQAAPEFSEVRIKILCRG